VTALRLSAAGTIYQGIGLGADALADLVEPAVPRVRVETVGEEQPKHWSGRFLAMRELTWVTGKVV
jgi:hypothetical protein